MEKMPQENLNREEELGKLEKLHKHALGKKVAAIHRSTKTIIKPLESTHFKLRDKFKWYYYWHTSRLSTITHWLILLAVILGIVYLGFVVKNTINYKNSIPQKSLSVVGIDEIGNDSIASQEENSNIKSEHSRATLEDKEITIGFIRKKADLGELVSWKNVSWSTDTPEGTSIVYRIKVVGEDKKDVWDKTPWSNYYPIYGSKIINKGIPAIKSKFMLVEVTLGGSNGHMPTLNYLRFGYSPFEENKIIVFIRDKIISGAAKVYKMLERREGISN